MTQEGRQGAGEIARVVIVGGGTAGWMAALYLRHFTLPQNVTITLVESPTVGSIGVGEATIPSIVEFVRTLGLDEQQFMRRCSASLKLAIKFENWRGPGSSYWHAFGLCGGQLNGLDLFHFWLKRRRETGSELAYSV
jgi:tryptophan halogenase